MTADQEIGGRPSAPRVVVIGGGATGCGVARDLILRGMQVTLLEFGDLGSGTSSRFHGMLQSGARYAVSDTAYGAECMRERLNVARLVPEAVEQCGGLFVATSDDPPDFPDRFAEACRTAAIPVEELDPARVMAEEPNISRRITRAFSVPDATVHSWKLVNRLADDIRARGGDILTRHQVTSIDVEGGKVRAVVAEGAAGAVRIDADVIVNATGSWSARVAALVGEHADLELTKGSIIVFSHRLVSRVVNRCRPPSSHDIMVPTGTVSLFGTTSEVVDDPDTTFVRPEEIQELLDQADPLIPGIRRFRAFRAWAGVRPLFRPRDWHGKGPLPRRHSVVDHGETGVAGFFTICGGSLTTHRSMAEDLGNRVCRHLGVDAACTSASTPLLRLGDEGDGRPWRPAAGFETLERDGAFATTLCECESVAADAVRSLVSEEGIHHLHDLRRRLRVGFGPCQGTYCGARAASLVAGHCPDRGNDAIRELGPFWTERLKGAMRTAWGPQARQALLSDLVYRETLGVRLTPDVLPSEDKR